MPNGNAPVTNGHGGHHRRESGETSTLASQFLHAVCDTLLNTGPIVDMAAGEVAIEEEVSDLDDLFCKVSECSHLQSEVFYFIVFIYIY